MERLFASIPAVLSSLAADRLALAAMMISAWDEAAGELVAERTKAECFEDGKLVVAVEDKTWQRHLEELAPHLLAKLNTIAGQGSVKFIEFKVRPIVNRSLRGTGSQMAKRTQLSPELTDAGDKIADENLRQKFLDTASLYLANQD